MYEILFPVRRHNDDRRLGMFDVFPEDTVEVNVAWIQPGQSAGDWHCHKNQTDYWMLVAGSLRIGLKASKKGDTVEHEVYGMSGEIFKIDPGTYHTYRAGKQGAVLVYGLTNKWDGTDEERYPFTKIEAQSLG